MSISKKKKKALIQMNFIEISLNYLISTINKKIANDKNSVIIIEKTTKLIERAHKNKSKKWQYNK